MMPTFAHILRLRSDRRGAVAVEFALVGPVFLAMLIAVFQIAIALQAFNAMRNVSADVARYALVQYQTGNRLTNAQLQSYAMATAVSAPYLMNGDVFEAKVEDAETQRVTGAREMTMTINYQVPTILDVFGWESPALTYERPMFVVN